MDIKVEKLPKSEIKLSIKLTEEENKKYEEKAARSLSESVKIPGFRQGKAPLETVKENIGEEKFVAYMLETAIPQIYTEAVKEKKLIPLSRPNVNIVEDKPIQIEATFATVPEVDLSGVDKIKIKAPKIKIDKKEIQERIDHVKKVHAENKEVDRAAKKGDRVEIDFDGYDADGKQIPNAKSENHPVVIGDGGFIPGFEDNLTGVKAGDEKEFTVTFPKDYHAEQLKGAKVTFKIKVHKVEEVVEPELDDKLVEKITGQKMSVDEFKEQVEHDLKHQKIHHEQAKQEEVFFQELLKNSKFEVSDILVDEEVKLMIQDIERDSVMRGMNFEEYKKTIEEKEGKSLEEIYHDKAAERVKLRFILDKLINEKKLEANKKEIQAEAKVRLEQTPESYRDKAKDFYAEGEQGYNAIRNEIILRKLFELYIEPLECCDSDKKAK